MPREQAAIPALTAEVENAALILDTPAARLIVHGEERPLLLDEVEALLAPPSLVVDACRYVVRGAGMSVPSPRARSCSPSPGHWPKRGPADVSRETLIARAFRLKLADESHRARLRVEIGRLRAALKPLAGVIATRAGLRWWRWLPPTSWCWRHRSKRSMRGVRLPRRRRVMVEFGPGAGPRRQPAHRATRARSAGGRRQGAVVRSRPGASLDDPAGAGFRDDLVTPGATAG